MIVWLLSFIGFAVLFYITNEIQRKTILYPLTICSIAFAISMIALYDGYQLGYENAVHRERVKAIIAGVGNYTYVEINGEQLRVFKYFKEKDQ